MKRKQKKNCDCVKLVNEQLKNNNAVLVQRMQISFEKKKASLSPPSLEVAKIDTKKRSVVPTIICSFCPFCGTEYA